MNASMSGQEQVAVAEVLDVDREYRERSAAGTLPTIAPRRFNAAGERWLPVLRTARGDRYYTALFSNTAAAHRFGRTREWVVIYVDWPGGEGHYTVVTAFKGSLAHRRVIRGRERECLAHYQRAPTHGPSDRQPSRWRTGSRSH